MRALRIIMLLVCLTAMVPLAAQWVQYRATGAVVCVHAGQDALAQQLVPMVNAELPRVAAALGMTAVRPFPIFAYGSRVDFLHDTGRQPDLLGESHSTSGKILLDASGDPVQTRSVLAHELAHSLLDQRLGLQAWALPRWVNEGIAGHLSDPVNPEQMAGVARMIHRDGPLTLAELEDAFPDGPYRDAAYLQSRAMMAWLVEKHPDALLRMIDGLASGDDFGEALHKATGLTEEKWVDGWRRNVPPLLYWLVLLFSSPATYSPLAIILIWAALRRILRKDEPPQTETDDEEDDSMGDEETDEHPDDMTPTQHADRA